MVNTALYIRVSTQEQATEGYSVQEQTDRLTKYSEAMGWSIFKVYTDPGFSGGRTDRPGLQAMINDIRKGYIDKVLVYKLDRLSRSQKDTLNLIEDEFLAHNVDFISMCENFDTSTPFGRAMVGILAVFAQLEREQIKERMFMGKEARAKEGKYPGAKQPPVGYDYINGELIVNPYYALIVKDMFNLALTGLSPYKIASHLNSAYPKSDGAEWTPEHVRKILKNKTYVGYIKHGSEYIKGIQEPIITEDIFDQVKHILDIKSEEHRKYNRRSGKSTTYLGGYLYCAHCGAKYSKFTGKYKTVSGEKRTYASYMCNSRHCKQKSQIKDPNCRNKTWRIDTLDNLVFDQIRQLALDPEHLPVQSAPEDDRLGVIKTEIIKVESQISKAMDLYLLDSISKSVVEDKLKSLNDRKLTLESELKQIGQSVKERLTKDQTMAAVHNFDDVLSRGNFDEIRTVIGQLIRKIEIDGEDITIYWNF